MYAKYLANEAQGLDDASPSAVVTVSVFAEDGVDLHQLGQFIATTAYETIALVHEDAHPDECPPDGSHVNIDPPL